MTNDSLGRSWQVATIQFDFNQPERFDLFCVNEEAKEERIVMIHAAIMGSLERFMSVLIEHTAGNFPLWLAPTQLTILPISDKHIDYAKEAVATLQQQVPNLRVELDNRSESIGKRVREAASNKVPYILVVGDKEAEQGTVAVRARGDEDLGSIAISEFAKTLNDKISNKSLT